MLTAPRRAVSRVLSSRRSLAALAALAVVAGVAPVLGPVSEAGAAPGISFTQQATPTVLFGSPSTVTLTATNPAGGTAAYNLSFRDVLPAGVSYVPASTTPASFGDPLVIPDSPSTGETTLLWQNVSDLSVNATVTLSFQLQATTGPNAATLQLLPGDQYVDAPTAYTSSDPRELPAFDASGVFDPAHSVATTKWTPASVSPTLITPIAITKQEPSPEAKLLRGVHDHATTYSLTVTNALGGSTSGLTVEDWLPAGLEFLGCGGVDHTTNAVGTNPGSSVEYPGAPHLGVGLTPPAGCLEPTTVETVQTTPPGAAVAGIYTHVVWTIADLAPGASTTLRYWAGVPLRANTLAFGGTAPTPSSGDQAANLDNNTGPFTTDGEGLTNLVRVNGDYHGDLSPTLDNPVYALGSHTVVAKDFTVTKSVTQPVFHSGSTFSYQLWLRSGEYRYVTNATVVDQIPNGVCPIDQSNNYAGTDPECAPQPGTNPVLVDHTTGTSVDLGPGQPNAWSVARQSDGTFNAAFFLPPLPLGSATAPAAVAPNTDATLTFHAVDRSSYDPPGGTRLPVVAGDSVTNRASLAGTASTTCVNNPSSNPVADPACQGGGSPIVVGDGSQSIADSSSATQVTELPVLVKQIADPTTLGTPPNCANATYVKGLNPVVQLGDKVCFRIVATFPSGVQTKNPVIVDNLPPNTTYVSAAASTSNTVHSVFDASAAAQGVLRWQVGLPGPNSVNYAPAGAVFSWNLMLQVNAAPSAGNTYDLVGNLAKGVIQDSANRTYSLRDQEDYRLAQPLLSLGKGVVQVHRGVAVVAGPFTPPADGVAVQGGDVASYAIDLSNTGLVAATSTTVWDVLPTQITSCASVSAISNGGTCVAQPSGPPKLVWSANLTVAAAAGTPAVPGTLRLTYDLTVPSAIGPGETLQNHAGVVSYDGTPNGGTPSVYVPQNNIDTAGHPASTWNSPAADDRSSLLTAALTFAKTATPHFGGPAATIGEPIVYVLTTTVPAGTTLHSGGLTDALGTSSPKLRYDGQGVALSVDGTPNPPGYSATGSVATNTITATFPATVAAPSNAPVVITVTFTATVADVAANVRGTSATNTATVSYRDSANAAKSLTASVSTPIVEPSLTLAKTDAPGGPYLPGQTLTYTVTAANPTKTGASTASALKVVDAVPAGLTVVPGSISAPGVLSGSGSSMTITWDFGSADTLAVGAQRVMTFQATLPTPLIGGSTFTNQASGTIASLDPTLFPGARTTGTGYQASATNTVVVVGSTVAKSVTPTVQTIGVASTYTATGTIPANLRFPNLTVFDTLPDGLKATGTPTITTTGFTPGACSTGAALQPLTPSTTLASGATRLAFWIGNLEDCPSARTVTITYTAYPKKTYQSGTKVKSGDVLTNALQAAWNQSDRYGGNPPSSVPDPATYWARSTIATAPITVIEPNLAITKTASTTTPTPGVPFSYTITVRNTGTAPAYDASFADVLPAGIVDPLSGPTVSGTNAGAASYAVANRTITWSIPGPVAPGASVTLTFSTQLVASSLLSNNQAIVNTGTISTYYAVPQTTAATDPSRYVTYGPVSASVTVRATFPALQLAKATPSGTAATVGLPFPWKLTLTNTSVAPAATTAIVDTLPPLWSYTPGSATVTPVSGGPSSVEPTISTSGSSQVLTWPATGPLAKGQSITVAFSATPQPGVARTSTNQAQATGTDATGASGNLSGPYQSNVATATATVQQADLKIVKTAVPATFVDGDAANTYHLDVSNLGPDPAAGPIVVDDAAPAGTSFTGASGTGWSCQLAAAGASVHCTAAGPVASGTSLPTIVVAVAIPADATGSVVNTATVSGSTYDPDLSNNTSTVTTPLTALADLKITKTHVGPVVAGQAVTYTVNVTNLGPSDSPAPGTPITVVDTLPSQLTLVRASGSGWSCTPGGAGATCTYGAGLKVGALASFTVVATVDPSVSNGTVLTNQVDVTAHTITDPNPANDHASDPATVGTMADLSISKTHDPSSVFQPGVAGGGTYTLAVANAGPSDALHPTVTDHLPQELTLAWTPTGTGWVCTGAVGTRQIVCTLNHALAAGAAAPPITVGVTVGSSVVDPTTITNTASVTSPTPDPDTSNNSSTDEVSSGPRAADLGIVKSHVGTMLAGGTGSYTVTVTNHGPSDVAAGELITVEDQLPNGFTATAASGTTWTCTVQGRVVRCTSAAGLVSGASAPDLTISVQLASGLPAGRYDNVATVSSPVPDPNPLNNTAIDPTDIATSADLKITKSHAPTQLFTPGTNGTWQLLIENLGPSDAAGPVEVYDVLPDGVHYVSTSSPTFTCQATGQAVTCTSASGLVASGTATIDLVVAVDAGYVGSTLENTASVTSPTPDPDPTNNSSTDQVTSITPLADLSISKSHPAGAVLAGHPLEFTITVTNHGPSEQSGGLVVVDPLPSSLRPVSASGTDWSCSFDPAASTYTCTSALPLGVGQSAPPITVATTVDPSFGPGDDANPASVASTGTTDPDPSNNSTSDPFHATTEADLWIKKSHTGNFELTWPPSNTPATYTLTVGNLGPSDAAAPVEVHDQLPAGLTYVAATGTDWSCGAVGQAVTCTLGAALPTGVTAPAITLEVAVEAAAYPSVTNTAQVTSPTPDPDPSNNHASDPTTVDPLVDLGVTKTHVGGNPVAGQPFDYLIDVFNDGPTADPGPVTMTDDVPSLLQVVSAKGKDWTCSVAGQLVTCTYQGAFAVGLHAPITLTVLPTGAGSIVNTAKITTPHPEVPNSHPNEHSDPTTIEPGAVLVATKTLLTPTPLITGETANYAISVTNQGPSPAEGVTVTDAMPAGLSATAASGSGWTCTVQPSLVTCSYGPTLTMGSTATVTVSATVTATTGSIVNSATVTARTRHPHGVHPTVTTPPAPVAQKLPFTGFDPTPWWALGAASAVAGAGLVWFSRRRRLS